MEDRLKQAGEMFLAEVHKRGLAGEAFLLHDRELSIEINQGEVETLKQAEQAGIGLRVFNAGRIGFAYSSDLSAPALQEVVKNAVEISAYTSPDEFNRLPEPGRAYPAVPVYDPDIAGASLEAKIAIAREAEETARGYDPRVELVERTTYADGEYAMLIMNSLGVYAFGRGNYCSLSAALVAREGEDRQNGFAFAARRKFAEIEPGEVGCEAAMRAIRSLNAQTIPSAQMPCILEPYVAVRFLNLIAAAVQADAVQKQKSMLAGKLGQPVASTQVDLVDDGCLPGGLASFPFDGEGVATQRTIVMEKGVLQGYLYDTYTGLKGGNPSTGNARRGSFRGLPGVGASNFILAPGNLSLEELMKPIGRGLYVTEVMGMHTANPISGDFSVGAAGIMVEDGRLTYPVRGITIAGNLLQLLGDIDGLGSDLRFFGGRAAPSVRLSGISIGGS